MKRYYRRTNKTKNFGLQIGLGIQRGHALTAIAALVEGTEHTQDKARPRPVVKPPKVRQRALLPKERDGIELASAGNHYHISSSHRNRTSITDFLKEVGDDPAYDVCYQNMARTCIII